MTIKRLFIPQVYTAFTVNGSRPTVTEWNANDDRWSKIFLVHLIHREKQIISNLYEVAKLSESCLSHEFLYLKHFLIKSNLL